MADNKELVTRSFRINEETADKFKVIAAQIGANQQETMAKLIETYEFQSGKALLISKKDDLEQFERYVNALVRMYMSSLEDNQNITETVRTEFDAQLKSKDALIQDLQGQLTLASQLKEEATAKAKYYLDENVQLQETVSSLQTELDEKTADFCSKLADKEHLNKVLSDNNAELKDKVLSMADDHDLLLNAKQEIVSASTKYDALCRDNEILKQELKRMEKELEKSLSDRKMEVAALRKEKEDAMGQLQQHEQDAVAGIKLQMQVALDKAVMETEKKYQDQLNALNEERKKEVDQYQKKYFELLEKLSGQKK